jgi:hypothetical protein
MDYPAVAVAVVELYLLRLGKQFLRGLVLVGKAMLEALEASQQMVRVAVVAVLVLLDQQAALPLEVMVATAPLLLSQELLSLMLVVAVVAKFLELLRGLVEQAVAATLI